MLYNLGMPCTSTAAPSRSIRDEILSLPSGSFFWSKELPGNPATARVAVSALAADPGSGVCRVAHGLYWRDYPKGHRGHGRKPWPDAIALAYAGKGSGFAGRDALSTAGWSWHPPRHGLVAVVGRRLRPVHPSVRFVTRHNERRKDLTRAEVTILEALAEMRWADSEWDQCMTVTSVGWICSATESSVMRPEAVAWAAETDDLVSPELLARADRLCQSLPEEVRPTGVSAVVF